MPVFQQLRTTVFTRALLAAVSAATARVSLIIDQRTTVNDADYTILATDRLVVQTGTLTAARTFTLPAASSVNAGQVLIIADRSGTITDTNTITIVRAGSDTINGDTSVVLRRPRQGITLISDGSSAWNYNVLPGIAGGNIAEGRLKLSGTPQYSIPGVETSAVTINTMAINTVRYSPILATTILGVDQLAIEVTTAGAGGKTARLGIYQADSDWQPTSLVIDAGTVAVDSTGVKTASASVMLLPGRYLTAINTDGAPALRIVRGGSRYFGFVDALGSSIFANSPNASQTYGAFPSPGTPYSVITGATSPPNYYVYLRISTP